jgi:hypothetical protein
MSLRAGHSELFLTYWGHTNPNLPSQAEPNQPTPDRVQSGRSLPAESFLPAPHATVPSLAGLNFLFDAPNALNYVINFRLDA